MPQASTPEHHVPQPFYILARHTFCYSLNAKLFDLSSSYAVSAALDALSLFSEQKKAVNVSKLSLSTNFSMNTFLPTYSDLYPMPLSSQIYVYGPDR